MFEYRYFWMNGAFCTVFADGRGSEDVIELTRQFGMPYKIAFIPNGEFTETRTIFVPRREE